MPDGTSSRACERQADRAQQGGSRASRDGE